MNTIEETRARLEKFLAASGISQNTAAAESGLSAALISNFLKGKYTGDNEKTAETLKSWIEAAEERLQGENNGVFYSGLKNTELIKKVVRFAHIKCEMALVYGDSGAGKTTALKKYAEENAGVIYISMNSAAHSVAAILKQIASELGRSGAGSSSELMNRLIEFLRGTKRLIIIDEADHLTLQALQAVRNLNDEAGTGIVLAGNYKLFTQLYLGTRGAKDYEFDQLRSRLYYKQQIRNDYTLTEISRIFPKADKASAAILKKVADSESLRAASKLYSITINASERLGEAFSARILKTTAVQFSGGEIK